MYTPRVKPIIPRLSKLYIGDSLWRAPLLLNHHVVTAQLLVAELLLQFFPAHRNIAVVVDNRCWSGDLTRISLDLSQGFHWGWVCHLYFWRHFVVWQGWIEAAEQVLPDFCFVGGVEIAVVVFVGAGFAMDVELLEVVWGAEYLRIAHFGSRRNRLDGLKLDFVGLCLLFSYDNWIPCLSTILKRTLSTVYHRIRLHFCLLILFCRHVSVAPFLAPIIRLCKIRAIIEHLLHLLVLLLCLQFTAFASAA